MRLYLIRHGKAHRHSASGRDHDRELAERGESQARWLGRALRELDHPPVRLLASPAARARKTAALVGEELGLEPEVCGQLDLGTSPSEVVEMLARLPEDAVAMVGHNPTLSLVADVLCRGPGGGGGLELRTGQAAVLEIPDPASPLGCATLLELLREEKH